MAKEKAIGEKVPLLCRGLLLALLAMPPAALCGGFTIYNISSYSPGRERIAAEDAAELKNRTGVDMALYSLTLHPEGRPAIAKAERYVESFGRFKRELEGTGVRAGVLVQAILGHWQRLDRDVEDWTRTIDSKGAAVRFCPLDPNFAKYITDVFTMIAKQHPAFILTDDDVRGYSHNAECFCERHMAIFNARRGTSYTSDELRAKLDGGEVTEATVAKMLERFHKAHEDFFGRCYVETPVEFATLRVEAVGKVPSLETSEIAKGTEDSSAAITGERDAYFKNPDGKLEKYTATIYERSKLLAGNIVAGPAIINQMDTTIVIEPDCVARVNEFGVIIIDIECK